MTQETDMNEETDQIRSDTIEKLQQSLAELEAGDELSNFIAGHGFQSRYFCFDWQEANLSIHIRLPYGRLLDTADDQTQNDLNLGVALRMTILLMKVENAGEGTLEVSCDAEGVSYTTFDADGNEVDTGDDWLPLVKRLEHLSDEDQNAMAVFWP